MTNPPHMVVAGTRRAWSHEQKQAIVAEADDPTTTVSAVARRHGLHPSLLFRWRRLAIAAPSATVPAQPAFIPLALPAPPAPGPDQHHHVGVIEIQFAGGHRLRADVSIDPALLRCAIAALVGR